MIRELSKNTETNWKEKIQLEMTLEDLQTIYECVGAMPSKYIKIKHKHTKFGGHDTSYYTSLLSDIYDSFHVILAEHNGVNDDDVMIHPNISLEIIGAEDYYE